MTLRIPNAAEEAMLDLILAEGYTLRLFSNDVEAGLTEAQKEALTAGSFTEATFPGYAAVALTGGAWVTTQGDDESTGTYAQQTFTRSSTGTGHVIRGYYVTRTTGGALRWYEYFPGPVIVANINDAIRVTPTFTLDDHREATVAARGMVVPPQILTTNSSSWTTNATTDHVLNNVPVDPTRDYRVKLHCDYQITGLPGRWLVWLHVDGVLTDRLWEIDHGSGSGANGEIDADIIWRPSAVGTPDLDVRITEVSGASTLLFTGASTATRQFSVEDVGPRLT